MSTTSQAQIHDAVLAALTATPALCGGRVLSMRSTRRAMQQELSSQIRVVLESSVPAALIGAQAPVDWNTRVRVECLARDTLGASPVSAFDAATLLCAQVQQRVLEDAALQAMVIEVLPAPMQWVEDEADTALANCFCLFELVHRAPYTNLIT